MSDGSGWRYLVGPEGSNAPTTVRNDVRIFDGRMACGTLVRLPTYTAWDTYFMVLEGEIIVNEQTFWAVEAGLLVNETECYAQVKKDALLVVFLINPNAQLTYEGSVSR